MAAITEADIAGWIGRPVRNLRQYPGGLSRTFWTLEDADGAPLVMQAETGHGPFYGTGFNPRREVAVLRGLSAAGLPVATPLALAPDGQAMVCTRIPGRGDFAFADEAERISVIEDYGRVLAALHLAPPQAFAEAGPVAATRREATLADIAMHEASYRKAATPHAVVDAALDWLKANVPPDDAPPSPVQGDAGPTNFMHENGKVTGLIDWEMAHLGDPHDDLAWVWFRVAMLGHDREVAPWFAAYAGHVPWRIEPARIPYYIAAVLLRCTISNIVRESNGGEQGRVPRPAAWLEQALADARGDGARQLPPVPGL